MRAHASARTNIPIDGWLDTCRLHNVGALIIRIASSFFLGGGSYSITYNYNRDPPPPPPTPKKKETKESIGKHITRSSLILKTLFKAPTLLVRFVAGSLHGTAL